MREHIGVGVGYTLAVRHRVPVTVDEFEPAAQPRVMGGDLVLVLETLVVSECVKGIGLEISPETLYCPNSRTTS